MNCPKCNSENSENTKFCTVCGNNLIESNNQEIINNSYVPNINTENKKKEFKKRILIAASIIVTIIIIGVIVSIKSSNNVIFCTSVDNNLKPTGVSDKFDLGMVTAELKNGKPLDTDRIKVMVYKIDGGSENIYNHSENNINPQWDSVALGLYFNDVGQYRVDFIKDDKNIIGSGKVTLYKK